MTTVSSNLRKAAVLLRSLDSDTAAIMLAQLSREEASSIRAVLRGLGTIDPEEQADVAAEFRRTRPTLAGHVSGGVELSLSSPFVGNEFSTNQKQLDPAGHPEKRFEFLASAATSALVSFLAREHAQTIAVVLAHLAPARAAAVLAELPAKLQAETIERLSALGEADPESVTVLERELAAWLATRGEDRGTLARRRETVTNILAAADAKTRRGILSKLKLYNTSLAEQIAPEEAAFAATAAKPQAANSRYESKQASETIAAIQRRLTRVSRSIPSPQPPAPSPQSLPRIEFDQLIHLDTPSLNAVLREVDANVLALALAGSRDELVDRVCNQMPKRTARAFRRQLRRLGPTRLSDVATAQRAVADAAARYLVRQRRAVATAR